VEVIIGIVALVAGVDRIFDMGRTTVNITGDASCSIIVTNLLKKKLASWSEKEKKTLSNVSEEIEETMEKLAEEENDMINSPDLFNKLD